jgi:hypothetical protein
LEYHNKAYQSDPFGVYDHPTSINK